MLKQCPCTSKMLLEPSSTVSMLMPSELYPISDLTTPPRNVPQIIELRMYNNCKGQ